MKVTGMSGRATWALDAYASWEEVAALTQADFLRRKNVGRKTMREVRERLMKEGLDFSGPEVGDVVVAPNRLRPDDDEIDRRARVIIARRLEPVVEDMRAEAVQDPEGPRVVDRLVALLKRFR